MMMKDAVSLQTLTAGAVRNREYLLHHQVMNVSFQNLQNIFCLEYDIIGKRAKLNGGVGDSGSGSGHH